MPGDTPDKCCVCSKYHQHQSNRLLTCGNCAVTVHEGCYGVQKIPGLANWFCRKCESQVRISKIRCDLCPIKEGAFKRSGGARCGWAHVICAVYFPEAYFKDPETMDLIMIDNIPSDRYGRPCVFCERNHRSSQASYGACIQCSWTSCRTYFHVTCALLAGLLSELPASVTESAESLAVVLTKMSNRNSDPMQLYNNNGNRHIDASSHFAGLHGFCSVRHKEKFSESVSHTPALTNSPVNVKPFSPATKYTVESSAASSPGYRETLDPPSLSISLMNSTPTTLGVADYPIDRGTSAATATSTMQSSEENLHIPTKSSSEFWEPEDCRLKNRASRKNRDSGDSLELTDPSTKRLKMETLPQKDNDMSVETDLLSARDMTNGPTTSAPKLNSLDSGLPLLSLVTQSVNSHPTRTLPKLADSTEEAKSVTDLQKLNSSLNALAPETKAPCNRRRQKKANHKPSPKSEDGNLPTSSSPNTGSYLPNSNLRRNLPLVWPQRAVSIRGFGLAVNDTDIQTSGSVLSDNPNPADTSNSTNSSSGTFIQSPLATMQDLLEWQWDQAGALLMQQVEGTDVVSLLDCLHQLKAENDSLEAKLVRLKTRQEHLRSVNARLATSLSTMESATVTMPSGDKPLTRTTQPLKTVTHEEAVIYTQSADFHQPTIQLNPRSTVHTPRGSLEQTIPGSPLLTAAPTVHPNLSPITVGGMASSPHLTNSFQNPYHQPQTVEVSKHLPWQTKNNGPVPSLLPNPYQPSNSSSTGHQKHTRRTEQNSPRKRSPKQWLSPPCTSEHLQRLPSAVDMVSLKTTVNSASLVELSARLSSAIAARQATTVQSCSDVQLKGNCSARRMPEYVPIAKNVSTYQTSVNRVSTPLPNKLACQTEAVLNPGLTHYSIVSNHHLLAETDVHSAEHQYGLHGSTELRSVTQHSGPSTTALSYFSSMNPSVPTTARQSPVNKLSDCPTSQPFPVPNMDPLPAANTLLDHSRS